MIRKAAIGSDYYCCLIINFQLDTIPVLYPYQYSLLCPAQQKYQQNYYHTSSYKRSFQQIENGVIRYSPELLN